jgi:hypothetical protein
MPALSPKQRLGVSLPKADRHARQVSGATGGNPLGLTADHAGPADERIGSSAPCPPQTPWVFGRSVQREGAEPSLLTGDCLSTGRRDAVKQSNLFERSRGAANAGSPALHRRSIPCPSPSRPRPGRRRRFTMQGSAPRNRRRVWPRAGPSAITAIRAQGAAVSARPSVPIGCLRSSPGPATRGVERRPTRFVALDDRLAVTVPSSRPESHAPGWLDADASRGTPIARHRGPQPKRQPTRPGRPPRPSRPIRQAMPRSTSRPALRGPTQPSARSGSARLLQTARWVDTEPVDDPSAAPRCLGHGIEQAPLAFPHGRTDSGNAFTDRLIATGSRPRRAILPVIPSVTPTVSMQSPDPAASTPDPRAGRAFPSPGP